MTNDHDTPNPAQRVSEINGEMQAHTAAIDALETELSDIQHACEHAWVSDYEPQSGPRIWAHCAYCWLKGRKRRDELSRNF